MSKITTADCRQFLATDPQTQALVRNRYDVSYCDEAEEATAYRAVHAASQVPKNWIRRVKYKAGGKADMEGGDTGGGSCYGETPAYAGGMIREFRLDPDTEIAVALLEKDGKLVVIDDLSD